MKVNRLQLIMSSRYVGSLSAFPVRVRDVMLGRYNTAFTKEHIYRTNTYWSVLGDFNEVLLTKLINCVDLKRLFLNDHLQRTLK